MMMKKILIAVLAFSLVGCMTSSLESQKPIFSAHSNKNAEAINRCLAPKWVELKASSTSIPMETGYKITASDDIFGALAVTNIVSADAGGSNVSVYAVSKGWNDHWGSAARSCM